MDEDSFFELLAGGGEVLEAAPPAAPSDAACVGCQQAQQELAALRCQLQAMELIKEKIIKTDQLIGRYSQLSARHREQSRRLEESSQLVAQLNRDCGRHETELSRQLLQLTELRQELDLKTAQLEHLTAEVTERREQQAGAEAAMHQYRTALQELERRTETDMQQAREKVIATEESRRAAAVRRLETEHLRHTLEILRDAVRLGSHAENTGPLPVEERKAFLRCKRRLKNAAAKLDIPDGASDQETTSAAAASPPPADTATAADQEAAAGSDSDSDSFSESARGSARDASASRRLCVPPPVSSPVPRPESPPPPAASPLPFTSSPCAPDADGGEITGAPAAGTAVSEDIAGSSRGRDAGRTSQRSSAGSTATVLPDDEQGHHGASSSTSSSTPRSSAVSSALSSAGPKTATAAEHPAHPAQTSHLSQPASPLFGDLGSDLCLNTSDATTLNVPPGGLGVADILAMGEGNKPPVVKRTLARVTAVPFLGADGDGVKRERNASGKSKSQKDAESADVEDPTPACGDRTGIGAEPASDGDGGDAADEEMPDLESFDLQKLAGMPVLVTLDPDGGTALDVSIVPSNNSSLSFSSGDKDVSGSGAALAVALGGPGHAGDTAGSDRDVEVAHAEASEAEAVDLPMPTLGLEKVEEARSVDTTAAPSSETDVESTSLQADLSMSDADEDEDTVSANREHEPSLSPCEHGPVSTGPRRRISHVHKGTGSKADKQEAARQRVDTVDETAVARKCRASKEERNQDDATTSVDVGIADSSEGASDADTDHKHCRKPSKEAKDNVKNRSKASSPRSSSPDVSESVPMVPGGWGALGARLSDDSEAEDSPGPAISMPLFGSPDLAESPRSCHGSPKRPDAERRVKKSAERKNSRRSLFDSPEKEACEETADTDVSTRLQDTLVTTDPQGTSCAVPSVVMSPDKARVQMSKATSLPSSPSRGSFSLFDTSENGSVPTEPILTSTPATDAEGHSDARPPIDTVTDGEFQVPDPVSVDALSHRHHHRHRRRKRHKERRPPEWERRLSQPSEDLDVMDMLRNMTQLKDDLAPLIEVDVAETVEMPLSPLYRPTEDVACTSHSTSDDVSRKDSAKESYESATGHERTVITDNEPANVSLGGASGTGRTEKHSEVSTPMDEADAQPVPEDAELDADHGSAELPSSGVSATRRPLLHLDSSGFEVSECAGAGEKPPPVAVLSPLATTAAAAAQTRTSAPLARPAPWRGDSEEDASNLGSAMANAEEARTKDDGAGCGGIALRAGSTDPGASCELQSAPSPGISSVQTDDHDVDNTGAEVAGSSVGQDPSPPPRGSESLVDGNQRRSQASTGRATNAVAHLETTGPPSDKQAGKAANPSAAGMTSATAYCFRKKTKPRMRAGGRRQRSRSATPPISEEIVLDVELTLVREPTLTSASTAPATGGATIAGAGLAVRSATVDISTVVSLVGASCSAATGSGARADSVASRAGAVQVQQPLVIPATSRAPMMIFTGTPLPLVTASTPQDPPATHQPPSEAAAMTTSLHSIERKPEEAGAVTALTTTTKSTKTPLMSLAPVTDSAVTPQVAMLDDDGDTSRPPLSSSPAVAPASFRDNASGSLPASAPTVAPSSAPTVPASAPNAAPATGRDKAGIARGCRFDWSRRLRKLQNPSSPARRRFVFRVLLKGSLRRERNLASSLTALAGVSAVNFADMEPSERLMPRSWWIRHVLAADRKWVMANQRGVRLTTSGKGESRSGVAWNAIKGDDHEVKDFELPPATPSARQTNAAGVAPAVLEDSSAGRMEWRTPTGSPRPTPGEEPPSASRSAAVLTRQDRVSTADSGRHKTTEETQTLNSDVGAGPLRMQVEHANQTTEESHAYPANQTPNQASPMKASLVIDVSSSTPTSHRQHIDSTGDSQADGAIATLSSAHPLAATVPATPQVPVSDTPKRTNLPAQEDTDTGTLTEHHPCDSDSDETVIRDSGVPCTAESQELSQASQELSQESQEVSEESGGPATAASPPVGRRRVARRLRSDSSDEEASDSNKGVRRRRAKGSLRGNLCETRTSQGKSSSALAEKVARSCNAGERAPTPRVLRKRRKVTPRSECMSGDNFGDCPSQQSSNSVTVNNNTPTREDTWRRLQPTSEAPFPGFTRSSLERHAVSSELRRRAQSQMLMLARMMSKSKKLAADLRRSTLAVSQHQAEVEVGAAAASRKRGRRPMSETVHDNTMENHGTKTTGRSGPRTSGNITTEACEKPVDEVESTDDCANESSSTRTRRLRRRTAATTAPSSPKTRRASRRQARVSETGDEAHDADRSVAAVPTRRRTRTSLVAGDEPEADLSHRRRRTTPARQRAKEDGLVTGSRRLGRRGLKREPRAVDSGADDSDALADVNETPFQPAVPSTSPTVTARAQKRSPRERNGSENFIPVGATAMRQLRSGKGTAESGQETPTGGVPESALSESPSCAPALVMETEQDGQQVAETTQNVSQSGSVGPSSCDDLDLSHVPRVTSPARTVAPQLASPPVSIPTAARPSDSSSSPSTAARSTPGRLAVHAVEAVLRPDRARRVRPTARQVSLPGSRLSWPAAAAVSASVSRSSAPEAKSTSVGQSQTSVTDNNADVMASEGAIIALARDAADPRSTATAADAQHPAVPATADAHVEDLGGAAHASPNARGHSECEDATADCGGNPDWAAEVSSDSDASNDAEQRLVIEDNYRKEHRGLTDTDAPLLESNAGEVRDSSEQLTVTDQTPGDDVRQQTDAGSSVPPAVSTTTSPAGGGLPEGRDDNTNRDKHQSERDQRQSQAASKAYTRLRKGETSAAAVAQHVRPVGQHLSADPTSGGDEDTDPAMTHVDTLSPDVTAGRGQPRSAQGARQGWKKQKRPLSPPSSDDGGGDSQTMPAAEEDVSEHRIFLRKDLAHEPSAFAASFSRPTAVTGTLEPPLKKQPLGKGSRLLAKLRRANSRPATASPWSSRSSSSSQRVPFSSSAASRQGYSQRAAPSRPDVPSMSGRLQCVATGPAVLPRAAPAVEVKSIYRRGPAPPQGLQRLGDWQSRPLESRVRRSYQDEADDGIQFDRHRVEPECLTNSETCPGPASGRSLSEVSETDSRRLADSSGRRDVTVPKRARLHRSMTTPTSSAEHSAARKRSVDDSGTSDPGSSSARATHVAVSRVAGRQRDVPAVLEEVADHRPAVRRPRLAHQAVVAHPAARAPAAAARRSTQRLTHAASGPDSCSPQLPSFYRILETPSHSPSYSPSHSPSYPSVQTPAHVPTPWPARPTQPTTPRAAQAPPVKSPLPPPPPHSSGIPVPSTRLVPGAASRPNPTPVGAKALPSPAADRAPSERHGSRPNTPVERLAIAPTEAELGGLVRDLLACQPDTPEWKRRLRCLANSGATDQAIASHLCHRVAVNAPPPPPEVQTAEAEPSVELVRACACAVQLQRRGRPRLRPLLHTTCRQQLLHRRPQLPLPCRLQLVRLHTALCRLWAAAGECRALLLDAVLLRAAADPADLLLAAASAWPRGALARRHAKRMSRVQLAIMYSALMPQQQQQDAPHSERLGALLQALAGGQGRARWHDELRAAATEALGADTLLARVTAHPAPHQVERDEQRDGECDALTAHARAQDARAALLLLSAVRGAQWTNENPLERGVVPILARCSQRKTGGAPEADTSAQRHAAAAAIAVTGELACLYPSQRSDRLMEEAVCILEGACETAPPLDATAAPPHAGSSAVAASVRSALELLLRRRLPEETERRLRQCVRSLAEPAAAPAASAEVSVTASGTDTCGGGGHVITTGRPTEQPPRVTEQPPRSIEQTPPRAIDQPRRMAEPLARPTEQPRPLTNWFGTCDEYF